MTLSRFAIIGALSLAFSSPAVAQPARQTILLWNFGYSPNPIYLTAGRPVTLTFVNRSRSSHDFVAGSFFANSRIISGDVMGGMVDLRGGEAKSVTLVPRAGSYAVHCSHFLHKQFGMSDRIIVS